MDHGFLQPPPNEDGPAVLRTPTASPAPADTLAETPAEARPAAGEEEPLEFPLQERHHRIISAFMAEHCRESSSGNHGNSPLPGLRGIRSLAAGLRRRWAHWWLQRQG
ncbi:MAG: hypothetical protein OXF25_08390 [Cyanobacteria bacterium MAG CAR3_bin_5]|nr:hypothetical protein [Cyanobacteria bacterium MAG CAR3_bin_5]MCY4236397.1 hypothetical protein [Cyanobacteria bacterium MAG CAR2_bin_4]MCY4330989.1 hypothetical protein [Cyanobacteria bacterium MAG CAR1_bin_15]